MNNFWIVLAVISGFSFTLVDGCTIGGRFLNTEVPGCKGYVMCIPRATGGFVQYNLTCPLNFAFNPLDKVCTNATSFQCNDGNIAFQCDTYGNFENTLDMNCSSYVLCSQAYNGEIKPLLISCPEGTLYNPILGECANSIEYECEKYSTTLSTYPATDDIMVTPTPKSRCDSTNPVIFLTFSVALLVSLISR